MCHTAVLYEQRAKLWASKCLLFYLKIVFIALSCVCIHACIRGQGTCTGVSHLLPACGLKLRLSGTEAYAITYQAILRAQMLSLLVEPTLSQNCGEAEWGLRKKRNSSVRICTYHPRISLLSVANVFIIDGLSEKMHLSIFVRWVPNLFSIFFSSSVVIYGVCSFCIPLDTQLTSSI